MPAITVHILELSDVHLRAEAGDPLYDRDPDARLEAVLAAWRTFERELDLVLLTGDQTDDGSRAGAARLRGALESLEVPIVAVLGNHDEDTAHAGIFDMSPVTRIGAWQIVNWNTADPSRIHGELDPAELLTTIDGLERQPTLLHVHHPPISPSRHEWFQLIGADLLLEGLAARPHVRAVLSGHVHTPFTVLAQDGPALLGCPSTLVAFRHRGVDMTREPLQLTGARYLELAPDGGLRTELLIA